ncbi:MAG: VIT1/CCC1 transporter family protein [Thermoproteota archaeon]|nr:VIT1/CCC1 transporter family protein [Candidatus Brockarchaeota archaeon]MBO3840397.1 VIT1/CCC1 transporter family protein [Candidatus Brockarchaeota archaeon]
MKEVPNEDVRKKILILQRNELTEHLFYKALSKMVKDRNSELLKKISEDELRHYNEWKKYTGMDTSPKIIMLLKYLLFSKIFGFTFAIKLMEKGEEKAEKAYSQLSKTFPEAEEIMRDEEEHEDILIGMIEEERIKYVGSMVLGINDALVELSGALAGLSLTLQNNRLIGVAGLVTGIAASLSMSASEYLSQKAEKTGISPSKAAFHTGIAYILTVILLTIPYLTLPDYPTAIIVMLISVILVISVLTFFISIVKDIPFRRMFSEMLFISIGVAVTSFAIGWIMRIVFNIEV